jgi:hypothetical protein
MSNTNMEMTRVTAKGPKYDLRTSLVTVFNTACDNEAKVNPKPEPVKCKCSDPVSAMSA